MSIIIAVLMIVCLVIYFIYSRKLKTPTVTTEVLIKKYNGKVNKLSRFLRKNKIDYDLTPFASKIVKADLTWTRLQSNITAIKTIEFNNELIEELFLANTKQELMDKIKQLKGGLEICEFAAELDPNKKASQILEILGYEKSKLDFEMQRYFGSQTFYKKENKLYFLCNSSALVVSPKNVFECEILDFEIKINKKTEKSVKKEEKTTPIYEINLVLGGKENKQDLLVPQKEIEKILKAYK